MTPLKRKTIAASLVAIGLGILAVTQMDAYIQKLFSYVFTPEVVLPPWLAPTSAGIGFIAIALGLASHFLPTEYIVSGLSADYQCITARRDELEMIHNMAKTHFGETVSSLSTMKRWHDKNREMFSILFRIRKDGYKQTREMVGYFCVIPLTRSAQDQLLSGQARAIQLQPADIEKPDVPCDAMYIGAIVGTSMRAKGNIVSILHREITVKHAKIAKEFLARPITPDGLRLVERFGFLPIDTASKGGIDALYSFKPDA